MVFDHPIFFTEAKPMKKHIIIVFLIMTISTSLALSDDKQDNNYMSKGRIPIVLTSTAYSAGLYGWGIPYIIDPEDNVTRIYVGSEMVATFGGFALSLLATNNYSQGPVTSKMIQSGALAGTLYGIALPAMFAPRKDKAYVGGAMIMTPIGALVGYRLSRLGGLDEGDTELINFGSVIGAGYGLAIPYLINIEDKNDFTEARIYAGSAMVGIPVGALAFNELSQRSGIDKGRARLIELGTCMGIYYGFNFVWMRNPGKSRPYIGSMIATLPVGTAISYLLTNNKEYSESRSMLIILGTILGDLSGRGIAYLFGADSFRTTSIGAMIMSPVGTLTSTMLTKNMTTTKSLQSSTLIDISSKLALLGTSYFLSRNGNEFPIYIDFCNIAF
jgi:hypothetical protein